MKKRKDKKPVSKTPSSWKKYVTTIEPQIDVNKSLTAEIATIKGGGYVHVHKVDGTHYYVHIRSPNVKFECSLGELEAIAAIYNVLRPGE